MFPRWARSQVLPVVVLCRYACGRMTSSLMLMPSTAASHHQRWCALAYVCCRARHEQGRVHRVRLLALQHRDMMDQTRQPQD
jgi:hypothetical protein